MAYPLDNNNLAEPKTTIVNILKMEGYKLDSGSLFLAFKDAGGEMAQFSPSLEELQEENIIKSDSEGNIMTVEDYQREKSQNKENGDIVEEESDLIEELSEGDVNIDDSIDEGNDTDEMKEMLRKKEKTDAWIIDKATNGSKTNEKLTSEITDLKKRVRKLEKILEKINEALK